MIDVLVGEKIPLILQVHDGNENLKVEATLFDGFGKEFMRVELTPIRGGLYSNYTVDMPEIPLLVAQYLTDKPADYEVVQDIFKAIPKPIKPAKMIIGEVIKKGLWDDEEIIIGEAHADKEAENT